MQSRIWRTLLLIAFVAPVWALSGCGGGADEGNCGPSNCGGCCLLGQCVMPSGQNGAACGAGGAVCTPCAQGQTCDAQLGGCVAFGTDINSVGGVTGNTPCGSTCSGCCDPLTNKCIDVAAQNDQNCGMSNQDCRQCASAERCGSGRCRRGGGTSSGECDPTMECFSQQSGRCELGLTRQNCGVGGQCLQCGTNEWCLDGTCQPGNTAMDSCLSTCAGKGCCNSDGRCIKFAASASDDIWGDLFGDSTLSNTQNDMNCGIEACIKCPAGYSCDSQVGECVDERYLRDFRICVNRIVVKDVPKDGGRYTGEGWWDTLTGDLWDDKKPDIRVTVKAGTQSGKTKARQGLSNQTVNVTQAKQEYIAQKCSIWSNLRAFTDLENGGNTNDCVKDAEYEWTQTFGPVARTGYKVTYGNDCPVRVSEDSLRGTEIEFVVEEVDLWGVRIGSCTGRIVGWQALEGTCDRNGMARCRDNCTALSGGANDERTKECLMTCYYTYDACRYDDGLVGALLIDTECDSLNVKHLEAKAIMVRGSTGF